MFETGIPNLDRILGGGVPDGDMLIVLGPAGSGKTTLCLQMAFRAAARGLPVLFASTLSESPDRLLRHTKGFSFFDESLVGRQLVILNIYPLIRRGLAEVSKALINAARDHNAKLLVLDGLMTVRDLNPETPRLRAFVYDLGATLGAMECTSVMTSSGSGSTGQELSALTMADGIVQLGIHDIGTRTLRTLRVSKMRGLAPLLGEHGVGIDADGVSAYPRLESLYTPGTAGLSTERVPLGLAELDDMLEGGLTAGSSTVLAGALGTGKTLSCLHYVMEGVRRGERAMLLGFRESPRQLMDKASAFGLDLAAAVHEGAVEIVHHQAVEMVVDEVTFDLWTRIQRFGPQRLAVDSVVELESAILDGRRRRGYVTALAGVLRDHEITTLFALETAQVIGPELDFSHTHMAVLAENLLMFRNVEFRGRLVGVVSILKMRESRYDSSIRRYIITRDGVQVMPREEMPDGMLAAIARLPDEVRVRRQARDEKSQ